MYNHQLDTFIKVAECGSFSKAANALYITTTAVIQQINLLEDMCGFQLFQRSNRGVTLTPAGKSLYEDSQSLISYSESILQKARLLAKASETTVRIGTSIMFKCRLLPELCAKAGKISPDLKFEIPPWDDSSVDQQGFYEFGITHDIIEGIFCTILWEGKYQFLELMRTPICCAVAKDHRLAKKKQLTMQDLNGEYLLMPIRNISHELDAFRDDVLNNYPTTQIIDSSGYGLDTFTQCEMNAYVLITQPVYSDIHTNLVTIPLETEYTLPYGLIYSNNPTMATERFIRIVKEMQKER